MNIQDVMSGKIDARQAALSMIKSMSPQQRHNLQSIIPQVEDIARKAGMDLGDFKEKLSAQLK